MQCFFHHKNNYLPLHHAFFYNVNIILMLMENFPESIYLHVYNNN